MLIGGNGIIHADFDGRQQISGVTEQGVFSTTDRFQSLDFEPRTWQATDGVVTFGDGIIVHAQANGMSFALRRSEENTSELQSLIRISYAVFCLQKKTITDHLTYIEDTSL